MLSLINAFVVNMNQLFKKSHQKFVIFTENSIVDIMKLWNLVTALIKMYNLMSVLDAQAY